MDGARSHARTVGTAAAAMTTTTRRVPRRHARRNVRYRDPVRFLEGATGDLVYPKQAELLRNVAEYPRTAAVGCNSAGKDWALGRLPLWWHTLFPRDSKCLILGPTHRQVRDIVWQHTRVAYALARDRGQGLGGSMLETPHWKLADDVFTMGFATNRPYNIDGFHSPHLLIILTQAHQLEEEHYRAVQRLRPERLVVSGNPFTSAGWYFDAFNERSDRWKTIRFSAYDSPNVILPGAGVLGLWTPDEIREAEEEHGVDEAYFKAFVLGEFPPDLENTLISMGWCKDAVEREVEITGTEDSWLGVDVAREGQDRTVVVRRDGPRSRIVFRVRGHDTERVAGWVGRYANSHPPRGRGAIVVDSVGIGAGVFDKLKVAGVGGWQLDEFKGGAKPVERGSGGRRYADRNAQAWYSLREALKDGDVDLGLGCPCGGTLDGCETPIPPNALDALIGQLSSRKYRIEGDQRIRLESKGDLAKSGRRSPDEADALAMTYGAPVRVPNVRFL